MKTDVADQVFEFLPPYINSIFTSRVLSRMCASSTESVKLFENTRFCGHSNILSVNLKEMDLLVEVGSC
jgi:hypothetical protein